MLHASVSYQPVGTKSSGCVGRVGIFTSGSPTILCVVWNSSGSIVGTDLTFFTMGLYLKMHMLASVSELGVECMGRGVDRVSKNVPSGLM